LYLFGESFGQVTLAQALFSGEVYFGQSQGFKIGLVSLVKSWGNLAQVRLQRFVLLAESVSQSAVFFVSPAFW